MLAFSNDYYGLNFRAKQSVELFCAYYKAMPYLFDNLKLSSFFSGVGAFEIALDRLYKDINSGNFINPQTE